MNAKGLTQQNPGKKVSSSKTENGETEVFVLPPDLLQKLGIHLGGIQTFSEPPKENSPSGFTNSSDIRKIDETFLETAKLMKKSVFLSPTFIPTVSNIPGELEIANIGDEKGETNTVAVQEVGLIDTKYINLESENIDTILVNINENVRNIIPCEINHIKSEANFIHNKILNTNIMSSSDINASHSTDFQIITGYEQSETIENISLTCSEPKEYVFNNTEQSNIETSIKQSHHVQIKHINENNSKAKNSVESLSGTYSPNLYPYRNYQIKKEHEAPLKVKIISEEILDSSKLRELKSLNSPNSTNLTPVTIKTVIHGRKINEHNKTMENVEGTYLKVHVNDEVENLKEIQSMSLCKDSPNSKSLMNIDLSNNNSASQDNISDYIISQMKYKEIVISDLETKNNESSTEKIIIPDVSNINKKNIKKETVCNFDTKSDSITILNDNLNISYKTHNVGKEDKNNKKQKTNNLENYYNGCVNTFNSIIVDEKVNKSIECDNNALYQKIQNTLESVCSSSNNPTLYKSNGCESALDTSTKSKIFLNDLDISIDKNSLLYSNEFINRVIENDEVIKNMSPSIIMKEIVTKPNVSSINTKSCIQGVEKPGGDQSNLEFNYNVPKILKTYKKRNKLKEPSRETSDCVVAKDELDIAEVIELNLSNIITTDSVHNQEFCICDDFGKLNYYENDYLYGHIHFCRHNVSGGVNSELISNMYNDQENIKYYGTLVENQTNDSCVSQENFENICWNQYKMDVQNHITKLDFNINHVDISKHCDINKPITEFENYELVDKEDDNRNINYKINKEYLEKQNQNIKKELDTHSSENFVIPSPSEPRNPTNPAIYPDNNRGIVKHEIVCDKLKIVKYNPSINSLDTLDKKSENVCKTRIAECNIGNTESTINRTVKCGICMKSLSEIKWEDHISNAHCYIAWQAGPTIDVQNQDIVKECLYDINKQYKGLICSECKVIYKNVSSCLKYIRKCDGTEDFMTNTSIKDPSSLNTSLEINEAKERFEKQKNIDIVASQSALEPDKRKMYIEIETSDKESSVIFENASIISTISDTHDQEALHINKSFECHAQLVVAKNNEKVDETFQNKEVNNDSHLIEIAHASSVLNADSTQSIEKQKTDSKKKMEPALREMFKEECGKNGLKTNQYTTNDKEVVIKNCDKFEKELKLKTEKEQPNNMSDEDNSRGSNLSIIKTPKNKTDNSNKDAKRKSGRTSEVSMPVDSENAEIVVPTEKKKKVSKASLSNKITPSRVTMQNVKCGVCYQNIASSSWFEHLSKVHNYLAWTDGAPALDLNDKCEVEKHLKMMLKEYGELLCRNCGCKRKYVKPYMCHIKSCKSLLNDDSELNDTTLDNSESETNTNLNITSLNEDSEERDINCGVCQQRMKSRDWLDHIQKSHNYIAWIEGDKALDTDDADEVQKHLMSICKRIGGLICANCGLVRKYIKTFLHHVKICQENASSDTDDSDAPLVKREVGVVQCGVCSKEMERNKWKQHSMCKHYNVAWIVGDTPIDLKNFYAVEKYLKDYKNRYNKLVCKVCNISRVSCSGFYAHILVCGKTEEETEMFKDVCEICNNKYICIYKHQHMAMHREQVYAKERKLKIDKEKVESKEPSGTSATETSGRRRAAEKAKNVIAKYKANLSEGHVSCKRCGFEADDDRELAKHNCLRPKDNCCSDSDVSVKLEQYSEEESNDTDVDSNVSDEEKVVEIKKRRHGEFNSTSTGAVKVQRIPYSVKHVGAYIKKSYTDFCQMHLTSETLFQQWHRSDYEVVSDVEKPNYMPPLKESCKIKFISNEWNTYYLFQASTIRENHIAFLGGTIQCITWAPGRVDDVEDIGGNYLAVSCHSHYDCPRYDCDEIPQHSNLIQFWEFGKTGAVSGPKFKFGIAHDYGTVWAMDWCPSGARDLPPIKTDGSEPEKFNRLGLLAIACSNGSAYILPVPYPSASLQKEKPFYRIKPVAELRLSMSGDKRKCQATSLSWSPKKDHAIIMVGYSDGMIASYDLYSDSPILRTTEDGVTILYPYHDERSHNTCITGVGTYAGGTDIGSGLAWSSASCSGARATTGLPGRAATVHTILASTAATFTQHWPSVQLTGDSYINNLNQTVNELEWVGGGRRLGGVRSWCACARCGLSAATAPPLIRVVHAHPAYTEIKKEIIGLLEMSPIGQKRKQVSDELALKLEPFNYGDAIKKYGLEFKLISRKNKAVQQKAAIMPSTAYPERYPLADITCMAFCPSGKLHNKLAMGTHAGLLIFIDV